MPPGGIRTHNQSRRPAKDLRLRPRGHWDRHVCIYRVQNVFLRCPTPRLHCFLSSHWHSFRFLSFMAFFIPSIQFFFGPPRALFCFGIHFNAILGSLSSAILWTWPYHVSWFCSISFIIVSSSPIIKSADRITQLLSPVCWYVYCYMFRPDFTAITTWSTDSYTRSVTWEEAS